MTSQNTYTRVPGFRDSYSFLLLKRDCRKKKTLIEAMILHPS